MCVHVWVWVLSSAMCVWFSPSIIWFPGIELELSGLGAGTFTYSAISPTSCVVFNLLSFRFACHSLPLLIISNLKWYLSLFRWEDLEKETDHSQSICRGNVLHPHKKDVDGERKKGQWRDGNGREEKEKSQGVSYADNHNLPFCIFWKLTQELCPYSLDQWSGTETVMTPSDGAVVLWDLVIVS